MTGDEKGVFVKGTTEDAGDILDFANMVFSMEYSRTDFAALLPKAYAEGRRDIPVHHMIRENGRIRALIALYPMTLRLNGRDSIALKAAYIGTVCVHPDARGQGYLTRLMQEAERTAVAEGCDLMLLDGNRHRYLPYGFERAGIRCVFSMGKRNISHCCAALYEEAYMRSPIFSFEELDAGSPYMDELYAMYLRRNVTARTREDFFLCLQSFNASVYAVLRGGKLAGYVNLSADEAEIPEFALDDIHELPRMVYDLMAGFELDEIRIAVGMDELEKIAYLEKMCHDFAMELSHHIKILHYDKVLEFLFRWKLRYDTLVSGTYVIGVHDDAASEAAAYRITVRDKDVQIEATAQKPDAVFDRVTFVRLLTTGFCVAEQQKGAAGRLKNAPRGWLPLPFYLPDADTF